MELASRRRGAHERGPSVFALICWQTGGTDVFAHSLLCVLPLDLCLFLPPPFLCRRKTLGESLSLGEFLVQSKRGFCTLGLRLAGLYCWKVAAVTHPSGEQEEEVTSPTRSHLVQALRGQQDPGLGLEPQVDAPG